MNSRLLKFLNAENITQAQFADSIGVARASISHIISGRNKPGYDFISATMQKYPQLNPEWLILGKGRMYKENPKPQTTTMPDAATEDLLFPDYEAAPLQNAVPMAPIPSKMNENPKSHQEEAQRAIAPESPSQVPADNVSQISGAQAALNNLTSPSTGTNARRVVKAIVFFDDGTFQELRSIF